MALPRGAMGCLRFVIVVFPDHTHLLFFTLLTICRQGTSSYCRDWVLPNLAPMNSQSWEKR